MACRRMKRTPATTRRTSGSTRAVSVTWRRDVRPRSGHPTVFAQTRRGRYRLRPGPGRHLPRRRHLSWPYGWGTWGSRSIAIPVAARSARPPRRCAEKMCRVAAICSRSAPATSSWSRRRAGERRPVEAPRRSISELARIVHVHTAECPTSGARGWRPGRLHPPRPYANASHVAVVHRPETGGIRLLRYVVVEDCGKVINPMIVDGQVRGGVAQGSRALLEPSTCVRRDGQPARRAHGLPGADRVRRAAVEHRPPGDPVGPRAARRLKGMGEGGTIDAPPPCSTPSTTPWPVPA